MFKIPGIAVVAFLLAQGLSAQTSPNLSDLTRQFISVIAPVLELQHVRVIDGTGGPIAENQTIVIENGTIRSVGPDGSVSIPSGARVLDLSGRTVLPGLVGMHDHLHYQIRGPLVAKPGAPNVWGTAIFTAPRLYLANGVTTLRSTGGWEPQTELNMKAEIDSGNWPGPTLYVTGPYLDGDNKLLFQNRPLTGPEDAARVVNFWADQGVTSFKAYQHITRAELGTAIKEAHARRLKITGHLCAVGFREAAELGIDGLEHGIRTDSEFDPNKKPDICPSPAEMAQTIAKLDLKNRAVTDMIHTLIEHHVSITSTPQVYEPMPGRPVQPGILQALSEPALLNFLLLRSEAERNAGSTAAQIATAVFRKEAEFEHEFVNAGGLLLAGPDSGQGGSLGGFGDLRNLELLVDNEFSPAQAVEIASLNGAKWLGIADKVGSVQVGKQADLVVVKGDPSRRIEDIENVEIVFKNGVGFDSQKLLQSVQGQVGYH